MASLSAYKELVAKQLKAILDLVTENVVSDWEKPSDLQMEHSLLPNESKPTKRKLEVCHTDETNKKQFKVN